VLFRSRLSQLIEGMEIASRLNFRDVEVVGISSDSRSIKPGDCFVAVRGSAADGHEFALQAAERGASVLVVERPVETSNPVIVVNDSSLAASLLAKRFYGDPVARLVLAGITGTNGKTSSSFLLRSILEDALGPTGIIGTVGYGSTVELAYSANTTPGPIDLYRIMADFKGRGCRGAVMEVSSHAAEQGRIAGLEFDVGVFTNATRDHLDYHGTFERYVEAKEIFVRSLIDVRRSKKPGTFVFNADDPAVAAVAGRFGGRTLSFGRSAGADVRAERLEADLAGTRFELAVGSSRVPIALRLLGTFSAYNALAAAGAAHALGVGLDAVKTGLERVAVVPGRFQVVTAKRSPVVIVDYAHTPDALEKLLAFCRELSPRRIVTVFGCGGDRDRGKRPMMGRIAADLSDCVIVTDDNPRTEDPERIVREIVEGMAGGATPRRVIRDRREAIREAVRGAAEGDLVVIAGKGHENEQEYGTTRHPFNDVKEAEAALRDAEVRHQL
jgi:UDP-N-acetylmuramoyl-L-alanyl-D-glutamate--2,6-diaminopimelate ligase